MLISDAMTPHLDALGVGLVPPAPDDLAPWITRAHVTGYDDEPHRTFVLRHDGPAHGDDVRTARFLDALTEAGRLTAPLDLARVARLQATVLGLHHAAPLREGDAFGRGGAHRYPWRPDLADTFAALLADHQHPRFDPLVSAVLLYLDVIFMHPFSDGNARLARLVVASTMARAGRRPPTMEALLVARVETGSVRDFWRMVKLAAASVGARRHHG